MHPQMFETHRRALQNSAQIDDIYRRLANWNSEVTTIIGGRVKVYANLPELRIAIAGNELAADEIVDVLGHTTPGDGGGGYFQYTAVTCDGVTALYDNNGTVILAGITTRYTTAGVYGACLRIGGIPCPEWYGGFPDAEYDELTGSVTAATDCMFAFAECIWYHGEMTLGPGRYGVDNYIARLHTTLSAGTFEDYTYSPSYALNIRNFLSINTYNNLKIKIKGAGSLRTIIHHLDRPRAQAILYAETNYRNTGTGQPLADYRQGPIIYPDSRRSTSSFNISFNTAFLWTNPGPNWNSDANCDGFSLEGVTVDMNGGRRYIYNKLVATANTTNTAELGKMTMRPGFLQVCPSVLYLRGSNITVRDLRVQRFNHVGQGAIERVALNFETVSTGPGQPIAEREDISFSEIVYEQPVLTDFSKSEIPDFSVDGSSAQYPALTGKWAQGAGFLYQSPEADDIIPPLYGSFPENNVFVAIAQGALTDTTYIKGLRIRDFLIRDLPMFRVSVGAPEGGIYFSQEPQQPYFQHGLSLYGVEDGSVNNLEIVNSDCTGIYFDSSQNSGRIAYENIRMYNVPIGFSYTGGTLGNHTFSEQYINNFRFYGHGDPTSLIYPSKTSSRGYMDVIGINLWSMAASAAQASYKFFSDFRVTSSLFKLVQASSAKDCAIRLGILHRAHIDSMQIKGNSFDWPATPEDNNYSTTKQCVSLVTVYGDTPDYSFLTMAGNQESTKGNEIVPFAVVWTPYELTVVRDSGLSTFTVGGEGISGTWNASEGCVDVVHNNWPVLTFRSMGVYDTTPRDLSPNFSDVTATTVKIYWVNKLTGERVMTLDDAMVARFNLYFSWLYKPDDTTQDEMPTTPAFPRKTITALEGLEPGVDYIYDGIKYNYNPSLSTGDLTPTDVTDKGRLIEII